MSVLAFEPYDFRGDLDPDTFRRFLVYAAQRNVSDILVQVSGA